MNTILEWLGYLAVGYGLGILQLHLEWRRKHKKAAEDLAEHRATKRSGGR